MTSGSPTARRTILFVVNHFSEEINLERLAAEVKMTPSAFCRKFQKECGVSPIKWLWTFRCLLAAEALRGNFGGNLTDVAFICGFASSAHFSRCFKETIGMSPSKFKNQFCQDGASDTRCIDQLLDEGYRETVLLIARQALVV